MIAARATRIVHHMPAELSSSAAVLAVSIALSVATGAAVAYGRLELAVAAAGGLFVLAALRQLPLVAWCALLLVTSVALRGVVTVLGLPESLNFLHYPVTAALAVAALQRPYRAASRAPAVWLGGLVLVTATSVLANMSHPLRALVFLLIVGEPLVVVWALSRWGISDRERRTIGIFVFLLAAAQLPIGSLQAASGGWGDAVQGTLAGHGGGSHVLGALFALGLLIIVAAFSARRLGVGLGLGGAATCLAMMLATGSMAITVVAGIAVMLVSALGTGRVPSGGGRRPRRLTAVVAGVVLGIAALSLAQVLVSNIFERTRGLATEEEFPELLMLAERTDDPGLLVFGSGPGTSASRASILLIGAEETGSPLAFFDLEPTPEAIEVASTTRAEGGGSAESARSSALAIIGDLGILGFAGLVVLFLRIWSEASRSDDWLAPAVKSALLLTAALIFVDSWLELPEFAVPLALLIGIVLAGDLQGRHEMRSPFPSPTTEHDHPPRAMLGSS